MKTRPPSQNIPLYGALYFLRRDAILFETGILFETATILIETATILIETGCYPVSTAYDTHTIGKTQTAGVHSTSAVGAK